MFGLEYPLLFGLPSGKLELSEGRSRCVFPFRTRDEGEAHLADWLQTLRRWTNGTCLRPRDRSLDGNAFREVSRFVHIATAQQGDVIGQKLQGDDADEGLQVFFDLRYDNDVVSQVADA